MVLTMVELIRSDHISKRMILMCGSIVLEILVLASIAIIMFVIKLMIEEIMIKKMLTIGILLPVFFTGCATVKFPQATGGSRSDGIVELSFDYGAFEKPIVSWDIALDRAIERCKGWGYQSADPFGGSEEKCLNYNEYGCIHRLITIKYQCIK